MPGHFVNSFSFWSSSDLPPDINRFEITLSNKTKKSKDPDICKLIQKFYFFKLIMKCSLKKCKQYNLTQFLFVLLKVLIVEEEFHKIKRPKWLNCTYCNLKLLIESFIFPSLPSGQEQENSKSGHLSVVLPLSLLCTLQVFPVFVQFYVSG